MKLRKKNVVYKQTDTHYTWELGVIIYFKYTILVQLNSLIWIHRKNLYNVVLNLNLKLSVVFSSAVKFFCHSLSKHNKHFCVERRLNVVFLFHIFWISLYELQECGYGVGKIPQLEEVSNFLRSKNFNIFNFLNK